MTAPAHAPLRWRLLVASIVSVTALAGCSDDDDAAERPADGSSTATTTTPAAVTGTTVMDGAVTEITITSPFAGAIVQPEQTVEGTVTGLPPGRELWLVVVVTNGRDFHPQDRVTVRSDGRFDGKADFGTPTDGAGESYELHAVLVDAATAAQFRTYVDAPEPDGLPGGQPANVAPVVTVDVTRQ